MFARNVSFHLKSNMLADYTRTFDKDILPLLRKQNGFRDEITFAGQRGVFAQAAAIARREPIGQPTDDAAARMQRTKRSA